MKTLLLPNPPDTPDAHHTSLSVRIADTFLQRLRGLLGHPRLQGGEGLLITRCNSVHMIGMRYPIDVAYLDRSGTIVKCVRNLRPWRLSSCRHAHMTLELAQGAIDRCGLRCGQALPIDAMLQPVEADSGAAEPDAQQEIPLPIKRSVLRRHTGASMVEFVVIAPALIGMGLGSVQYGLLFFAKNNINYATFEAARAGSMANANIDSVTTAYRKALIPMYGGGTNADEMAESYEKVKRDTTDEFMRVELLNPTRESFDDWNAKPLQDDRRIGDGKRVIPVLMQNFPEKMKSYQLARDAGQIGPTSGQNLADASLIKVRIIHGYRPQVPFIGKIMTAAGGLLAASDDPFKNALYASGRIPVTSYATLQMQSDAIESRQVSSPGMGNGGKPVNPDPAGAPDAPPGDCITAGCAGGNPLTPVPPAVPPENTGQPTNPWEPKQNDVCPADTGCPACKPAQQQVLSADALFAFDKSGLADLLPGGKQQLDKLIDTAKAANITSANIIGYTDQLGAAAHNDTLSLARAKTIRDYLASHGFPAVPVTIEGRGAKDPVTPLDMCPATGNAQIKCLQPNRRVVVEMQS